MSDLLVARDGGVDVVRGSFDDDELWVYGSDTAYGGPGFDRIRMLEGTNTAYGGDENDFIEAGGDQPQTTYGEEGDDNLVAAGSGGSAVSDLRGGPGADVLELTGSLAVLRGGRGNDVLSAGLPSTLPLLAGGGDDTLYAAQAYDPTPTPALCGPGLDTVLLDLADVPDESCEVFSYEINGTDGDDVIAGTSYDDTVLPFTGKDVVRTGAGDDTVLAQNRSSSSVEVFLGAGDDRAFVNGGDAVDTVHCGAGVDTVVVVRGFDVVDPDCERVNPVNP
jgi:Ca2+-binding RTX toxin-like protein